LGSKCPIEHTKSGWVTLDVAGSLDARSFVYVVWNWRECRRAVFCRPCGARVQLQGVPISDLLIVGGLRLRPESFLDRIGALKQNGIKGGDAEQREAEGLGVRGHSDAEVHREIGNFS
jgi:hypothetical protein